MRTIHIPGQVDRIGPIAGRSDGSYVLLLKGSSNMFVADGDNMAMGDKDTWGITMALTNPGDRVTVRVSEAKPNVIIGFDNHEFQ